MKNDKSKIKESLQSYCERYGSQNKAAASLQGVSSATISQVLNDNWELINDKMWMSIAAQIGFKKDEWIVVETRGFKIMNLLLTDSKLYHLTSAIVGNAGKAGKTESIKSFEESNKDVYFLSCAEYWNRKLFLVELLQKIGKPTSGLTVGELMNEIIKEIKKKENPIIIMDEADKLSDQVLYFFITLYNQLEDHCGIIICATKYLEKRFKKGLRLGKKGYEEICSRIVNKFIEIPDANSTDIYSICVSNGISDRKRIDEIIKDSDFDLRRVKKMIHASKRSI